LVNPVTLVSEVERIGPINPATVPYLSATRQTPAFHL